MPASVNDDGRRLALIFECLYLANLTVAPVIGFLVLWKLSMDQNANTSALARCHLRQAMRGSLWAGILLMAINGLILALGGYHSIYTIIVLILYFFSCHSLLILLGIAGIAKALAGQPFIYPLIGARCE